MKTLPLIAFFTLIVISLVVGSPAATSSFSLSRPNATPTPTPKPINRTKLQNKSTNSSNSNNSNSSQSPSHVTVTPPASTSRDGCITKIRISVQTGEDDLRNGSRFKAFLRTRDDRRIESNPLNCRRLGRETLCIGIPGGTRRTYEWELRTVVVPVYPQDIYTFGLIFETGSTGPFDTGDNWNVDRLEVDYIVTKGSEEKHSPAGTFSLYRNSGSPLYRFKTRDQWETDPLRLPL